MKYQSHTGNSHINVFMFRDYNLTKKLKVMTINLLIRRLRAETAKDVLDENQVNPFNDPTSFISSIGSKMLY